MIANISWITDDLATGGDLAYNWHKARAQMEDILEQGVTHILDMRQEADDKDVWEKHPVEYLHLPTDDSFGHHIPFRIFDAAVEVDRAAREAGGKTLAHCHMGINRGPSVAFALLLDRGMAPEKALDAVVEARPIAGVYYASDALRAHLARENDGHVDYDVVDDFRDYFYSVFTEEKMKTIDHVIRQKHVEDWQDYVAGR